MNTFKPSGHKIGRPNDTKAYKRLPLQDAPTFIQLGLFGLKIYHLATLLLKGDFSFLSKLVS
jgi:hypothetical protein